MYGHPYSPYEVQEQFMTALYDALSHRKIAIFESPTGTGKTLSLLCPSVAWLRDSAKRALERDLRKLEGTGPAWLVENAKKMRIAEFEAEERTYEELLATAKARAATATAKAQNGDRLPASKKQRRLGPQSAIDEFLLEDVDDVLTEFQETGRDEEDPKLAPLRTKSRVFFASRTHSQLAQVAGALSELRIDPPARFAVLGSRKQLCIHPEVRSLRSVAQMNDKCAELQKHAKCSYRHHSHVARDQMLGEIMDIEDLARFGSEHASCPYYASREAVPYAEVVALPYAMLLTRRNREALGVDVSGAVVVIDEAHNLVDAVTSLHSATLTSGDVSRALGGLTAYDRRVGERLSPANRRRVRQIIRLVESLAAYFAKRSPESISTSKTSTEASEPPVIPQDRHGASSSRPAVSKEPAKSSSTISSSSTASSSSTILSSTTTSNQPRSANQPAISNQRATTHTPQTLRGIKPGTRVDPKELLAEGNVDTLDIAHLAEFVRSSKLVFKVDSYVEATQETSNRATQARVTGSLGTAIDFVLAATDPAAEGKLFHEVDSEGRFCLRYLVLDAAPSFKDIVDDARCVVLAGGTMEPMSEFTNQLLPYVSADERALHAYGHIVPPSQLLVMPVPSVKLTFANRSQPTVVAEVGRVLQQIVANVPHGVVAFFPGYSYLASVIEAWKRTGVFAKLEAHKRVFAETTGHNENTFERYAGHARKGEGALLLAVVGGRLSEGINFSDELARAVVMVGLPFPNAFSAEMVAKREFIEAQARQHKSLAEAKEDARLYYENVAMRAVNQSVGRAIRHIRDYAAIYLLDERYAARGVQAKLSRWVRESIQGGDLVAETKQFFKRNSRIAVSGSAP